jgi:hypothetical protein
MSVIAFQQIRYYDPGVDAEAARISGFDRHGGEFWMRCTLAPSGRARRQQFQDAQAAIAEAIEAGLDPGEVVIEV